MAELRGLPEPPPHKCFVNWDPKIPASAMEADAIREGFCSSLPLHQSIYDPLIADRDSSVYKSIIDADPYMSYGLKVSKRNCVNHLLRNASTKLELVRSKKGLGNIADLRKLIEQKNKTARNLILKPADNRRKENVSEEEKVENLRNDILTIPYHVFDDHRRCASFNLCDKEVNEEEPDHILELQFHNLFDDILEIFDTLASFARCILMGYTNNLAEGANSISAKVTSGKRVNYSFRGGYDIRINSVVIQNNTLRILTTISACLYGKAPEFIVKLEDARVKKARENDRRKKENKKRGFKAKPKPKVTKNAQLFYGPDASRPNISKEHFERKFEKFYQKLLEQQRDRDNIAKKTMGQSSSEDWFTYRRVRLTASNFGRIFHRRQDSSKVTIVNELLYNIRGVTMPQLDTV